MAVYKGIKLADSVKLYKQDGDYNKQIKRCLDRLADMLKDNNHTLKSRYVDDSTKVLIDFHCGHNPYLIKPTNYKQGKGCRKCSDEKNSQTRFKKSEEDLIKVVKNNGHKLLSEYKGDKEKLLIDFSCGHKPHWIEVSSYKRGKGNCRECGADKVRQSKYHQDRHKEARESLLELIEKNGHKLLSEYKANTDNILIDFDCEHEPHWISPNNYKSDRGCPFCSESKGEEIIRKWLENNGVPYESQYIFDDLPNRKYDFFLPSMGVVIEVQGVQHYKECYFTSKNRTLAEEKENDRVKREFVESIGCKYIEVDYRESNPRLALKRFVQQYSKLNMEAIV